MRGVPGRGCRIARIDSPSGAVILSSAVDSMADERRDSVRRALDAQEGERLRVARELHDEVGQTLTSVVLQLGTDRQARARRLPGRADRRAGDHAREP
jgi:two-component system sensor histidine kinase UhpB